MKGNAQSYVELPRANCTWLEESLFRNDTDTCFGYRNMVFNTNLRFSKLKCGNPKVLHLFNIIVNPEVDGWYIEIHQRNKLSGIPNFGSFFSVHSVIPFF